MTAYINKAISSSAIVIFLSSGPSCSLNKQLQLSHDKVPRIASIRVGCLGSIEDKQGFISTIKLGESHDKAKCSWLYEYAHKTELWRKGVTNLDPNYFVLFLDAKRDVVSALECNGDNFHFVEAKKTFWSYYVGPIIPVRGDKWKWGEIPNFKKTIWRMCK